MCKMCPAKPFGIVLLVFGASISSAPVKKTELSEFRSDFDDIISIYNDCNCVCGVSNRQMRIVGGNITKVHEFPWLAGLSKDGEFYCGATVVTRRHLLTAAHCVEGFDFRKITVALGDHDRHDNNRFSKIQVRNIKTASSHKMFDPSSYNNDISILELTEPLEFDSRIQPACLPTSALIDYTGEFAIVSGWGKTKESGDTSPILQKVAVPVWSKQDCYNSGYGEQRLSENMFCAGFPEGGKDACQGDSGGPLHIKDKEGNMEVIGIVSWGRGCGRPNLPGIYTKVVNYLDWIYNNLNGECLCPYPSSNPRRA